MNSWIYELNSVAAVWWEAMARATWQGAIALGLVWILSRCAAAIPAAYKVWLWRLAFVKLLIALLWFTPISLPILPSGQGMQVENGPAISPVIAQATVAPAEAGTPYVEVTEVREPLAWRAWLLMAWIIGVLWAAARVLRQWRCVKRLLRNAERIEDPAIEEVVTRIGKTLGLRRLPAIYQSSAVCSPMLIAIVRPRIILPSGVLSNGSALYLELMLAHELGHVRRHDLWWQWLFALCEIIFFFHPVVWLARREWNVTTEGACDQLAVRATQRAAHDYGSMLLQVVAGMSGGRMMPAVASIGMFETATSLKRRLKAMSTKRTWFSTAAGIVLISVATLALVPCRLVAETADAETLARLKEENAKLKEQLEATRAEMESLRKDAIAARQRDEDIETMKSRVHADAVRNLDRAQRDLDALLNRFTTSHPDVISKRRDVERLRKLVEETAPAEPERYRYLDHGNKGLKTRMASIPATAEQIARHREQRALLAREIELAEKQVEFVRKNLEAGKEIAENLLRVQREVLELKLQQAGLSGSKADRMAVLAQQLHIAQELLNEQQKRIKLGTLAPGAELSFEREVLRLQRELGSRR